MATVQLVTRKTTAQQSVIETLEELLVGAKSGEIVEVCAAVVYSDGHTGTFANQTEQRTKRIGSVAQMLHDLMSTRDET